MPYRRCVRYASPLVAWHELTLTEAKPRWGAIYRVDSPRLLIPGSGWMEAEQQGQRFVCDALTMLTLTPEVPYRTRQPHAGQRSVVLVFSGSALGAVGTGARQRLDASALWRLALCRAAIDRGDVDELGLQEALLALPHAADVGQTLGVDRGVERARELLASDPCSSASLHDVAHQVGVSPFHLARRFKAVNGTGLHAHRTRLRMALALARLRDGERDLTALALDLGYSSHSHFTAVFRAHFRHAPRHARLLLAGGARFR
jgi:AraC-like DNA-binding protein